MKTFDCKSVGQDRDNGRAVDHEVRNAYVLPEYLLTIFAGTYTKERMRPCPTLLLAAVDFENRAP
jgi:hypothetical protein